MSSRRVRSLGILLLTLVAVTLGVADERAFILRLPIEQRLKKRIAIDFEDTPFAEAIETLKRRSGIDIVIDKPALDNAGVSMDTPLSTSFHRIRVESALKWVRLRLRLACLIRGESVVLTGRDNPELALSFVSVAYPIADLMGKQWADLPSSGPTTGAKVMDLMIRGIDLDSWGVAGGQGTIEYSQTTGRVVVFQSLEMHEQIQDLLVWLRRVLDKRPTLTPPTAR